MNKDEMITFRPRFGHKSSSSFAAFGSTGTPSLGNSPTTVASSFDSAYDFYTRPLLPRHNPMYALSGATKSADLVIPHIPHPEIAIFSPDSDDLKWEKKSVKKDGTRKTDGLGALIHAAK